MTIRALLVASLLLPFCAAGARAADDRLREKLAELDRLYDGVYPWLARVHDAESGGFFESLELRRKGEPYGPDIQSTAMALSWLESGGVLAKLPVATRDRMIAFFQRRQDPATGYFLDPHYPQTRDNDRVKGRALGYATRSLTRLGSEPLHPLPGASPARRPAHVASEPAFRAWLDARPWDNAWAALDQLQAQTSLLKTLPPDHRDALVRAAYEYVKARQDPQTGFAGGGSTIVRISGAAKFGWFCNSFDLPIPRADALCGATLAWYRGRPTVKAGTLVRNPIHLLSDLEPHLTAPVSADDKLLVLDTTIRLLKTLRQRDGGFAMFADSFRLAPNDMKLAEASGPQSDMNGTAMAHALRDAAYRLAGVPRPPPPGAEKFLDSITRAGPR